MSCDSERIRLPDGSSHLLRYFGPESDPSAPVALLVPAMGVRATYYTEFAATLAAHGVRVALFDLRGQGESSPAGGRGARHGFADIAEVDIPAVHRRISTLYPEAPVWVLGHSLGGQMALLGVAHNDLPVEGVVVIAAGSAWWRARRGARSVMHLGSFLFAGLVSRVTGYWPGDIFRFGGKQSAQLVHDAVRQSVTGRYSISRASSDYEQDLARMNVPVLMYYIDGDTVTPPGATDHLLSKLKAARITRRRYTPAAKAKRPEPHFAWVRGNPQLAGEVAAWIRSAG